MCVEGGVTRGFCRFTRVFAEHKVLFDNSTADL